MRPYPIAANPAAGLDRTMKMEEKTSVAQAIRAMLPQGVGLAVCDIDVPQPPLWPEEEAAVRRAVPSRIREFTAGRAAARLAMTDIGLIPGAVTTTAARAPAWPPGLSGSITHTARIAAAVVSRQADWPAIGLDLERAEPMSDDMAELIRHPLDSVDPVLSEPLAATLLFSAKEAAFKAQFPLTGLWIDYSQVPLTITADGFTLSVQGVPLSGRWRRAGGLFATTVLIGTEHADALRLGGGVWSV